jgi:two-component system, cell cycle sensor histidine kinase and response regulator CckA
MENCMINKKLPKGETEPGENLEAHRIDDDKLEDILEIIEDGFYELDISGTFTFVNDALCKIFGYHRNKLIGSKIYEFADQANNLKGFKAFKAVNKTLIPKKEIDWEITGGDGKKRYVEASISPITGNDNNNVTGYRGILRDVTGRKLAEADLRKSEERFRFLIEKSPLGIALMDNENNYKYLNPKFIEMFGYDPDEIPTESDWLNKAYPDKEYRDLVITNWKNNSREYWTGEARIQTREVRCRDGSRKTVKFTYVNMESGDQIIFCEDVTEQKRLENQLVQAQKVESLGTLAGGIAHNFNNLLMGIQGNSSLMLMDLNEGHPYYTRLKNIEKLVASGAKLTYQLLGYARAGNYEIRPINLNKVIQETTETFSMAKKEIRVHLNLNEDGCGIIADHGQIEQVLLNLFVNAADAMHTGGDLYVDTSYVNSSEIKGRLYTPKPGDYVFLSVRDTGIGIDQSIINRIFDPFFTTKGLGRGTGLGLASVYGIIKAHGGYIDVESKKGEGTTFTILLPKSKKGAVPDKGGSSVMIKGSGTILVADDEEMVLDIAIQYLEMLGYNVISAKGGNEASGVYMERWSDIDLVILDLIMPDMGGGEVYDLIKTINPDAKVILSSGYSIEGQASEILERGCNGFIQKPFDMETLSMEIKKVLNSISSEN